MKKKYFSIVIAAVLSAVCGVAGADVKVTATNPLSVARPSETIVVTMNGAVGSTVHVMDQDGKEVVSQVVNLSGKDVPDELVFQADFGPSETKAFTIKSGAGSAAAEPKVSGRFVPERYDDFAWENDRIAFRIYGPKLELVEPASSGIDVWVKSTRAMVQDKWYKTDDYHKEHGEGLDCYKVGFDRGCGGVSVWKDNKEYISHHFDTWKRLANGPVRFVFELTYKPWDAGGGEKVGEVKRFTLDAGQNLNHIESTFTSDKGSTAIPIAIGISKHPQPGTHNFVKDMGVMRYWDAGDWKVNGSIGCAVVMDPAQVSEMTENEANVLLITKATAGKPLSYYAGAGWDKGLDFKNVADWDAYLTQFAMRLKLPIQITLSQD